MLLLSRNPKLLDFWINQNSTRQNKNFFLDHIGQADRSLSVHASARSIELLFVVLLIAFIGICWLPMAALATRAVETSSNNGNIPTNYKSVGRIRVHSVGWSRFSAVTAQLQPASHLSDSLRTDAIARWKRSGDRPETRVAFFVLSQVVVASLLFSTFRYSELRRVQRNRPKLRLT